MIYALDHAFSQLFGIVFLELADKIQNTYGGCITRKLFTWIIPYLPVLSNDNDKVVSFAFRVG